MAAGALLLLWAVSGVWAQVWAEAPVVTTEQGRVSGVAEQATDGRTFYSYYGIPYAEPPVGPLRLRDPVAAGAWPGVRDGSTMPPPCPQLDNAIFVNDLPPTEENVIGQEDCLYLNVFTPSEAVEEGKALAVLVWVHGGGYYAGAAQEYLPHALLNRDVVLVVIQYRLSLLGFMTTEDSVMPGNFGMKDQTLALRWVQHNIHHFGGDRARVAVAGESAGGASAHLHTLSPHSKGLFSRVILMSGTALCPWAVGRSQGQATRRLADTLGCPTPSDSHALLLCLQQVPVTSLMLLLPQTFDWWNMPLTWSPRVDGDFLPDEPARLLQQGRYAQVEVMSGTTRDDGSIFALGLLESERLQQQLVHNFSVTGPASLFLSDEDDPVALAQAYYHHFLASLAPSPQQHVHQFRKMMNEHAFTVCHDLATKLLAGSGGASFRYELTHRGQLSYADMYKPGPGKDWVIHLDDLYYLFRGGPLLQPPKFKTTSRPYDLQDPHDLALRHTMTTLWVNFAATGNPTPDDSLGFVWESSSPADLRYLNLTATTTPAMHDDRRRKARIFHATLPTRINKILHPHMVRPLTKDASQDSPTSQDTAQSHLPDEL